MNSKVPTAYSPSQRVIHWLTVLLVMINLLFPDGMEKVADAIEDGKAPDPADWFGANLHLYCGIAILALSLLRVALRLIQGAPPAPAAEPLLFQRIARIAHGLFYALLFAMPLSGLAAFYLGIEPAGEIHGGPMKLLLWLLILGHVAAVLVHKLYWKTDVLERMTSGRIRPG